MKTIVHLAFLLLAGCSIAQSAPKPVTPELTAWQLSLRSADQAILEQATEANTVLKANTATLQSIASKIESLEASLIQSKSELGEEAIKSEDTSPADNANDSQPVTMSVAEAGDVPLYVSVTTFCRPCNQIKKDWKAGKFKGFDVKFCVETETHRQQLIAEDIPADRVTVDTWNGTPFPAIRHPSKESASGWVVKVPHGYGPEVLHDLRRDLLGINGEGIEQVYPQTSAPMQSHGDLVSLHNSLHGCGNWTWRGDLATHLIQSHGVDLNGTAANYEVHPVVRARSVVSTVSRGPVVHWRGRSVLRSNCPNGRCP